MFLSLLESFETEKHPFCKQTLMTWNPLHLVFAETDQNYLCLNFESKSQAIGRSSQSRKSVTMLGDPSATTLNFASDIPISFWITWTLNQRISVPPVHRNSLKASILTSILSRKIGFRNWSALGHFDDGCFSPNLTGIHQFYFPIQLRWRFELFERLERKSSTFRSFPSKPLALHFTLTHGWRAILPMTDNLRFWFWFLRFLLFLNSDQRCRKSVQESYLMAIEGFRGRKLLENRIFSEIRTETVVVK